MKIPFQISRRMAGVNQSLSTAELFTSLAAPASHHRSRLERFQVDLMDFEVSGSGEVPNPTHREQWAPWEPRIPQGDAHDFETGCCLIKEHLCRLEEQEFDFLLEFYYLIPDEICDQIYRLWEENQLTNAFHQVSNATPLSKEKTREAVGGPSAPHSSLPGRDAAAEWAAAVEEGILEAAKHASVTSGPREQRK